MASPSRELLGEEILAVLPWARHVHTCWGSLYPGARQGPRGSICSDQGTGPEMQRSWFLPGSA